jgi:hypothetical protein
VLQRVRERPLAALGIAVGVVIIGRLVDLQWHLTHDEFEGTSQQFRAHTVVWIGVLLVLTVTAVSIRGGVQGLGYRLAFGGAALYVPVAVWHFAEHASGNDPEIAHILLGLADLAIAAGAVVATTADRRRRAPAARPPG